MTFEEQNVEAYIFQCKINIYNMLN